MCICNKNMSVKPSLLFTLFCTLSLGASFFFGYELTKYLLQPYIESKVQLHMVSACLGEVVRYYFSNFSTKKS